MAITPERLAELGRYADCLRDDGYRLTPAMIDELIAEVSRLQALVDEQA